MDIKERNELYNKNRTVLKQAYPRVQYHPFFGYDIIALSEIYYPDHMTNDKSLFDMIADDKGESMANLVQSIL